MYVKMMELFLLSFNNAENHALDLDRIKWIRYISKALLISRAFTYEVMTNKMQKSQ